MGIEQYDRVSVLKGELLLNEKRLEELKSRYEDIRLKEPGKKGELKDLKQEIRDVKKVISQKKDLIMILGDNEVNYEHGDIFDKVLDKKADHLEDEIIRVNYPLQGAGLALFMEIRELYYKIKKG